MREFMCCTAPDITLGPTVMRESKLCLARKTARLSLIDIRFKQKQKCLTEIRQLILSIYFFLEKIWKSQNMSHHFKDLGVLLGRLLRIDFLP